MMHKEPVKRTPEQEVAEKEFRKAGHAPENPYCDHSEWKEKHGRHCPKCGACMWDAGD